jgi:hypothetical protein
MPVLELNYFRAINRERVHQLEEDYGAFVLRADNWYNLMEPLINYHVPYAFAWLGLHNSNQSTNR